MDCSILFESEFTSGGVHEITSNNRERYTKCLQSRRACPATHTTIDVDILIVLRLYGHRFSLPSRPEKFLSNKVLGIYYIYVVCDLRTFLPL